MQLLPFFLLYSSKNVLEDLNSRCGFTFNGPSPHNSNSYIILSNRENHNISTVSFTKGHIECPEDMFRFEFTQHLNAYTTPDEWSVLAAFCRSNAQDVDVDVDGLYRPLIPGDTISIISTPTDNTMFEVGLLDGLGNDQLFYIHARFNWEHHRRTLVYAAFINEIWHEGGQVLDNNFPYKINRTSNTTVAITKECFMLYVDSKKVAVYHHLKFPVKIVTLLINGDVTVDSIRIQ